MRSLHSGIFLIFHRHIPTNIDVSSQLVIRPLHSSLKRRGRSPGPSLVFPHCDCGTCGPEGAGGACSFWRRVSRSPPLCPGGARGLRSKPASSDKSKLVAKNTPAKTAVVRVRTFDVPRLERNPPLDPMPRPPPSDFCSNTTPTMVATTMR
jgi:hypothetical protein